MQDVPKGYLRRKICIRLKSCENYKICLLKERYLSRKHALLNGIKNSMDRFMCHSAEERIAPFCCISQERFTLNEYCMGGGAYDEDGLWKPNKEGLGMAHVIEVCNKIYGKNFIKI